ncbi:MAG: hypothetical protein E7645_09420 [Ruminococcaceae bacterium]|nr:hypothetical protein [Oscillospiraceae bacterium]
MSENYTPKPPRICPVCGSAVADTFDVCPTCGSAMPAAQTAPQAPQTSAQEIPMAASLPEGATIIKDRKTYFNFYLPRQLHNNLTLMAVLAQLVSLFLGTEILLGEANNLPFLFIAHTFIITALGIWVLEAMDIASTVTTLVYTVVFFFVSLIAFDSAYWYPVVAAVLALIAAVNGNKNWRSYNLSPIPLAELSPAEKKTAGKTKTVCRMIAIILAVVLLVMGAVMVFQGIEENKLYEGYSDGHLSGNTYQNDYAGITFEAPKGWLMMNQEELDEYNIALFGFSVGESYALAYADNGAESEADYAYAIVYVTKYGRPAEAEDSFDELMEYNRNFYGSELTEELESVTLNGITYRVCHSIYSDETYGTYDEYILMRTLGRYTYEIYLYPNEDTSYSELLDCFVP